MSKENLPEDEKKETSQAENENSATEQEDELITKIKELEDKAKEYETLAKRKVADFDNFRKRMQDEKKQFSGMMTEKIMLDVLPLFDNLERAIESAKQSKDFDSLLQGIEGINQLFTAMFQKYNLTIVDSVNQPFDAALHHALYTQEGDYKEKTVIQEVEKAIKLNDKIIRTAKVAVGVPKKTEESSADSEEKNEKSEEK